MPSRYVSDSDDASTFEKGSTPDEGVRTLIDYINRHPKETKPSRSQVVICVEHRSNLGLLEDELDELHNTKWLASLRSRIVASCFDDLDKIIDKKAPNGSKASLVLLVTPLASWIKFDVPKCYKKFILVGCPKTDSDALCLAIDPTSRYCKIPFPRWDTRQRHLEHDLQLKSRAGLVNQFGNPRSSTTLFSSDFQSDIRSQAERLQDSQTTWKERRGIVASILGGLVGGSAAMAAKLYTCTKLTSGGIFLQCQSVKVGFGSLKFLEIGSATLKAGYVKTSLVAAAELVGAPLLIGAATGVTVGALVYFMPWDSVFDWLRSLWNGFWNWLVEKFEALRKSIASWWREDGRPKKGQSHHSRSRSRRVSGH
ncbi:hypothetical protein DL98DRAFT_660336 [Cadophora sp. DSE1049]|nr:hypothetical protein DL98DRAFT_660336 [Cadophora sp. DSE1049]